MTKIALKGMLLAAPMLFAVTIAQTVTPDPATQSAPADGWAGQDGGTQGGAAAAANRIYVVKSRAQLLAAIAEGKTDAKIIRVQGLIDMSEGTAFANMDDQKLRAKIDLPSNTTLIGEGTTAGIINGYINVSNKSQVIVRNLKIVNPCDVSPVFDPNDGPTGNWNSELDGLTVQSNSHHVWIDHVSFTDSPTTDDLAPIENGMRKQCHDGALDIKGGSNYVTVSYSVFELHSKNNLIGSSDSATSDEGKLKVTFSNNLWRDIGERAPRVRFGQVHLFNNLFIGSKSHPVYAHNYSVGAGKEAKILSNANVFEVAGAASCDDVVKNPAINGAAVGNFKDSGSVLNGKALGACAVPNVVTWTPPYAFTARPASLVKINVLANAGTGKLKVSTTPEGSSSSSSSSSGAGSTSSSSSSGAGSTSSSSSSGGSLNLSVTGPGAGADGSSKGTTSFGNIKDAKIATFWTPDDGDTEKRACVKWSTAQTIDRIILREEGTAVGEWRIWDYNNTAAPALLISGNGGIGAERIIDVVPAVVSKKLCLAIPGSLGAKITELETYGPAGSGSSSSSSSSSGGTTSSSSSSSGAGSSGTGSTSSSSSSSSSGGPVACVPTPLNIQPIAGAAVAGTVNRPQLTDAEASNATILATLAKAGQVEAQVTDNWDPVSNGIGDVCGFTPTYTIAADGSGTHTTVQGAIDAATAAGGTARVYINVKPGTYREQVCVKNAPPITLYGTSADASQVVIVNNKSNGTPKDAALVLNACEGRGGQATYGTSGSTTFLAYAAGFQAKNITIANDFDESTSSSGLQAVALTTSADKVILENVRLLGHQDTFQPKSGNTGTVARVYVAGSYIEGDVDFVFGRAVTVFNGVTFKQLVNRLNANGNYQKTGYVFAPAHPQNYTAGFLVTNSVFTAETTAPDGTATENTLQLGRAWDDSSGAYTATDATFNVPNGLAVIRNSLIGVQVQKATPWGPAASTNRAYSSTTPQTITFGGVSRTFPVNRLYEYFNSGAGATP
ncbi:pectinesterase family protein [Uliginosibacterium sp. H1]|uniref:pectinesterase family protein n=1 Tax=Uliginosibacterium sp. H1 TaxID=3114757 RepID=UPI002E17D522|nr:pectinesterase family protein [Uliginosibacterium sp. H1]